MTGTPVTLPQGSVPIGTALINGVPVQVIIHPEWMRALAQLVQRTGGVSAPVDLNQLNTSVNGLTANVNGLSAKLTELEQRPPVLPLGRVGQDGRDGRIIAPSAEPAEPAPVVIIHRVETERARRFFTP